MSKFYANQLGNIDEMDKFLERHKIPNLIQDIENLIFPIRNK